ncbi:hypothetical protein HYPSUDRAFT_204027 [Hypholoma sublateritium FD-334 SS-4]|uniref:TECPR1-like DysF domain-containing protein n=1 Tax=Hypholoma sublateritium (strain FD-334 SS-4) TaxID=945553 RepID=A0A0D2L0B9_HYPSF|nr:hypothetical protein HYPSUDRAFT_204027 [Hypholoma sublateritium FD-334 SS-4]
MATMDYVDVPAGAVRLRHTTPKDDPSSEILPVPRIYTSYPHPSPPPSPTTVQRRASLFSASTDSLASPTLALIPQLLLSSTLAGTADGVSASGSAPATGTGTARRTDEPVYMSSKDPLSLPTMSVNFKRFVSIIGPVFWLQDRIEEVVLWKRGWLRTTVWMAAYTFLCFYPRLLLLTPHIALISIILSTYPYPDKPSVDPLKIPEQAEAGAPVTEGSVPWQANITGIQNLMGSVADLHDLVQPHLYHLCLTPAHLSTGRRQRTRRTPSSSSAIRPAARQSPYTLHILQLLVLTLVPLLFVVHMPGFPLRAVCIAAGLAPFAIAHPVVRRALPVLLRAAYGTVPLIAPRVHKLRDQAVSFLGVRSASLLGLHAVDLDAPLAEKVENSEKAAAPVPLSMTIRRAMDDDRLTDACWNAEMREVYLWENERFGGPLPADLSTMATMTGPSSSPAAPQRGWSKQNLRAGERTGWTRGQDGGAGAGGSAVDGVGQVSSNLTFSLAPGWAFVETEDWRKDVQCAWAPCGGDPGASPLPLRLPFRLRMHGWVYTNDVWLGSRAAPYAAGGGSLTRRRRWVRRVWFDPERASADG